MPISSDVSDWSSTYIPERYASIDVARGVIMLLMALDHASAFWNSGRPSPCLEGAVGLPPVEYGSVAQQITREITHLCAPGFHVLAGMGLAISVDRRQARHVSQWSISKDIVLRGLVLCGIDFTLMFWAYDRVPMFFSVLACIGCSMILFAALRRLPLVVIGALSLAVILGAPCYAQTEWMTPRPSHYPVHVLFRVVLDSSGSFMVLYPLLPWVGCFGWGWCLGSVRQRYGNPRSAWYLAVGLVSVAVGIGLRWFAGAYGDRLPGGDGPRSAEFWALSKYPPSPAFLLITLGLITFLVGLLRRLDAAEHRRGLVALLGLYGGVPLFFFVVHVYAFAAFPVWTGTVRQYGLATTYLVWLVGMGILTIPCAFYARLRTKHRRALRWL